MERFFIFLGAAALLASSASCSSGGDSLTYAPDGAGIFEPMPPAKPGEWLHVRKEAPQTFSDYKSSRPNGPASKRGFVVLVPYEQAESGTPGLLGELKEFLEAFFMLPARIDRARPVPERAAVDSRKQHDAGVILDDLVASLPDDAAACLGIMELDLFHRDLNFVFGLGSFENRSSVCSLARYRFVYMSQPADATLLKRACRVAAHEVCHVFGLRHCAKWRCLMNGSNSIVESDSRPMLLCPDCLEKLRWRLGFDAKERYERLQAFYLMRPEFAEEARKCNVLRLGNSTQND